MSYPAVTASVPLSLKAGEKADVRFSLCLAYTPEGAYSGAQHMLAMGPAEYGAMVSACASVTHMSSREVDDAMGMLQSLWFISPKSQLPPKSSLWRCGLSGDLPIICCKDDGDVVSVTKQFCLLRSCGVYADLVFLTDEGGEYRRPVYSKVRDTLASHGLEALIGTHAGVRLLPTEDADLIESAASFIVGEDTPGRRFENALRCFSQRKRSGVSAVWH